MISMDVSLTGVLMPLLVNATQHSLQHIIITDVTLLEDIVNKRQ